MARHPHKRRHRRSLGPGKPCVLVLLLWVAAPSWAQEWGDSETQAEALAQVKPVMTVVPRLTVTETFTDNVNLSNTARRAEQITAFSPGIRITRESGRITGYFDYALSAVAYAQGTRTQNYLHALSTAGEIDALNQWLFIDFSGDISQQSLSALGPLPGAVNFGNTNSAEVSRYSLAPLVRGVLGDALNYTARVSRSVTQSNSDQASGVGESLASLNLASAIAQSRLGWVADASRYDVDYSAGRATESDQADVGLSWVLTPQFSTVLKVGREGNNYTTQDKRYSDTSDLSMSWQASPQAQASASWGKRSFGDIHAASVEYHTPLFTVRLADRRDISAVPAQVLAVLQPSPQGSLNAPGQALPVIGHFVTTAVSLQDRQDLVLGLQGVRDTVTLALSHSETSRLDTLSQAVDDLSRAPVQQIGFSLEYNHRLSPRFSLDVLAALQKASSAPGVEDGVLRQISLSLGGHVSRRAEASVSLHHAVYTGASPYTESALAVSLTMRF